MMKNVSVHCTASKRACMLFVRSVVKSVQAYCRFAMAIIAIMHAISLGQRGASVLFPRAIVISVSCLFVRFRGSSFTSQRKNDPRNHTTHAELDPAKGR